MTEGRPVQEPYESSRDVRDGVDADFGALVRLWQAGWTDAHAEIVPAALARLRTLADFTTRMRNMFGIVRVIGPVGAPLGFHAVKGDELEQFYVSARVRGTGAAELLLHDAETRLAAGGTRIAWLACALGNDRAARFYEKHGWRRVGTVTHHPETPEGPFALDVWRYEKPL
jgi:ribosomal protein S18 acetylase RimI-like enzyme